MKSKPTPWGVKVWCSADPDTGYLLDFDVYTGKSQTGMKGGLGHHVMTVGKRFLEKGHHFYHDNFFTSIQLADELLDLKTRCCGTIRINRKGWPKELTFNKKTKKADRLKVGEVKMMQRGNMVATVWQDKRTIALLSTNEQPVVGSALRQTGKGRKEQKAIPQPILTYNKNMGGVDNFDAHRAYYPVGRPCRKWWRYLLWFFVQTSLINAFIIYKRTNQPAPKSSRQQDPL
ncbi:hypothetical protein V1264_016211 [Littorina saxatilis]|uniref:PiggyBac transposable element-derived protein domain-containing protein n=2 Tax=Littorina saxatilis TaxID=31220 RepID=A0AAN9BRP1_9CAEN